MGLSFVLGLGLLLGRMTQGETPSPVKDTVLSIQSITIDQDRLEVKGFVTNASSMTRYYYLPEDDFSVSQWWEFSKGTVRGSMQFLDFAISAFQTKELRPGKRLTFNYSYVVPNTIGSPNFIAELILQYDSVYIAHEFDAYGWSKKPYTEPPYDVLPPVSTRSNKVKIKVRCIAGKPVEIVEFTNS